jgi:hypothetical protein
MKYKVITQPDAAPVVALDIGRIEIVVDDEHADRIELYILDSLGNRVEGGTFDRAAFIAHVSDFYNLNY